MNRTRILHIITQLDVGGAERQLLNLCDQLPPDRYECGIVTLAGRDTLAPEFATRGVTVCRLDRPSTGGPIGQMIALIRFIRAWRPDILQTWLLKANHVGRIAAALAGQQPVIASYRDIGFDAGSGDTLLDQLLDPGTHLILHNSRRGRRALLERVRGTGADRHQVLVNGIDCDSLTPSPDIRGEVRAEMGLSDETPVVIMVARLHAVKDPHLFIEAARRVRANWPAARFWLVGGGPMESELRELLGAEPDEGIWLSGERSDVPRLLAAADISLLTSSSEGLSNSILEAMSCGLPALATDVGGNGELVQDGVNGYIFRERTAACIAATIEKLLAEPEKAAAMGRAGRRIARETYSLAHLGRRAASFYERVLAR
ncbi:MAG: glycosyltransferase [bacterium]|nr:glycosyltransferase [bacterium]